MAFGARARLRRWRWSASPCFSLTDPTWNRLLQRQGFWQLEPAVQRRCAFWYSPERPGFKRSGPLPGAQIPARSRSAATQQAVSRARPAATLQGLVPATACPPQAMPQNRAGMEAVHADPTSSPVRAGPAPKAVPALRPVNAPCPDPAHFQPRKGRADQHHCRAGPPGRRGWSDAPCAGPRLPHLRLNRIGSGARCPALLRPRPSPATASRVSIGLRPSRSGRATARVWPSEALLGSGPPSRPKAGARRRLQATGLGQRLITTKAGALAGADRAFNCSRLSSAAAR